MLVARAIFFTAIFPGTVTVLVPWRLLRYDWASFDVGAWRFLGAVPLALGALVLLYCITDFLRMGRGTLAPVDPPKVVVTRGLYGYVRNPMYLGVLTVLAGEGLWWSSWLLFVWMAIMALSFHAFVRLYEEPTLRRDFGESYEAYQRAVPRWLPRRRRR